MRKLIAVSSLVLIGAAPPPSTDARLRSIIAPVSQQQLRHTIETLVSFGTRHTLSSQTDPKLGESCDVCHATGADYDVAKMHAK